MAYVDWKIRCLKMATCNCPFGCPCEFNGLPVYDVCQGIDATEIVEGHFGEVRLDGLRAAGVFHWPGPVHEGKGSFLPVIDARATEEQRNALFTIFGGEEQEPTTVFNIYGSTIEHELEPVFSEIEFACDVKAGTGRVAVDGLFEANFEPIRNPVTGKAWRAMITLPEGWEFREAEVVSANAKSGEGIRFDYAERYGSLWQVTYGPYGIVD